MAAISALAAIATAALMAATLLWLNGQDGSPNHSATMRQYHTQQADPRPVLPQTLARPARAAQDLPATPTPATNQAKPQPTSTSTGRRLDAAEEVGRQLHRCIRQNDELRALIIADFSEDSGLSAAEVRTLLEEEDNLAALFRVAAIDDPYFQELAGPMAEVIEIQCRWFREHPESVPWRDKNGDYRGDNQA